MKSVDRTRKCARNGENFKARNGGNLCPACRRKLHQKGRKR